MFNCLGPGARKILDDLTGNHDPRQRTTHVGASIAWQRWERQYASDGELQSTLPAVLKLSPNSHHGNVNEIIGKFGGANQFRNLTISNCN
jgi:hypothetical protein